jgi:hypothetical protein
VSRTTRVRGQGALVARARSWETTVRACLGKPPCKQTLGNWPAPNARGPLPSRGEFKKLVYDCSFTKGLERRCFVAVTSFQQRVVAVAELSRGPRVGPQATKAGLQLSDNAAFCRFLHQPRPLVERAC